MTSKQNHTDIITKGWVEYVPAMMRPYFYLMRLDRPIGTWLLLLPAWWSILLSGGIGEWRLMVLFAIGAIIMRGAGCVINDLWDRDLDGKIERTATRPIPAGNVNINQTIIFVLLLLLSGLFVLAKLNYETIMLGFLSLFFVIIYPLMKRVTWWPQAFLGLTFNFGALMGWVAVTGELSWQPILLYASGFFWTLGYDTIYAMQDRADDALVGVKSSARYIVEKLNKYTNKILYLFYFIHFILFLIATLSVFKIDFYALYVLCLLPLLHLIWQVRTLLIDDPKNSLKRFQSNRDYGLMWCVLIIIFLLCGWG
jgi:4-hydroxybenzoate polyprenyltransferase